MAFTPSLSKSSLGQVFMASLSWPANCVYSLNESQELSLGL